MEISSVNTHPSYKPDYWRYEVMLFNADGDGGIVTDCIYASEEKGEAITLVIDENGIKARPPQVGEPPGPEIKGWMGRVTIRKTDAPVTERYSRFYLNVFGTHHKIVRAGSNG
jgi:hypothetical protein